MKKLSVILFLVFALPACGQGNLTKAISVEKLGEVLSCLQTKLSPLGSSPPQAGSHFFRVRYYYGILTTGDDEANELQLVVYAPRGSSAVLYRVYFDTRGKQQEIFIGDWGTLKKDHGRMVPDENPGGVATYYHIKKLLDAMAHNPVITIPVRYVKRGRDVCVYRP